MNNFNFYNPVKILFGKGKIAELSKNVSENARILLTYGGGSIFKNGVYDQVIAALKGFTVFEFGGIEPNPKYETLMKAVELVKVEKIDFLLAVGGGISDAVIANINKGARIPLCGQISLYNSVENPIGPRIQQTLLRKSALMQGFIVTNYTARFGEGIQQLAQWLGEGKLTNKDTIVKGFELLPETFIGLFHGTNTGKLLVQMTA